MSSDVVTSHEAAQILGLSLDSVRRLSRGDHPTLRALYELERINGARVYRRADVEALAEQRRGKA